jgi:hypothetical protein
MWAGLITAPAIASSVYANLTVPFREQGVKFTREPDGSLDVAQISSEKSAPVSDEARDHPSRK